MSSVKNKAVISFRLKGPDLEQRGAIAQLMVVIQMTIEKYNLPVAEWHLDSFDKVS